MQPKLLCIYFCYNQSLQKSICEYTTCQTLKQQQQKTTPSAKNNNVRLQFTLAHQIGK